METKSEGINYKNINLKKHSKEEVTNLLWETYKKYCLYNLPKAYQDKTFEELEGETMKKIIDKLKQWDTKNPSICSILSNQNGIGKTHLAVGLIKEICLNKIRALENENYEIYLKRYEQFCKFKEWDNNPELQNDANNKNPYNDNLPGYITSFNLNFTFIPEWKLLLEYRKCMNFKSDISEEDFIEKYSSVELLAIDDVFSTKEGNFEFSRSILFTIIENRSIYKMKPTILTSNLSIKEIADIDTRIASRISNSMLIEISSKQDDYRGRL
jgi:DNA replication protein DnaC